MFQPGDLVLCVNDDVEDFRVPGVYYTSGLNGLTKGIVYTVRSVEPYPETHPRRGSAFVLLSELRRNLGKHGVEIGYHPARFRPLRKLEIESFVSKGELV